MNRFEYKAVQGTYRRALVFVAALALSRAYTLARNLLVLVALAVFFSFLLTPLVRLLERTRIGRVPAVLVVGGFSAAALLSAGWFVGTQAASVAGEIPKYTDNIVAKVRQVRSSFSGFSRIASQTVEQINQETIPPEERDSEPDTRPATISTAGDEVNLVGPVVPDVAGSEGTKPLKVEVVSSRWDPVKLARDLIPSLLHLLTALGIAGVLATFILVYREDLRDRLLRLCGRARISVTTSALSDMGERLTRFLVVQVLVNGINGVAIACGLLLIGVPNAVLWGLLAGLLRFVPFLGLWIAGALPVALSIAVFESGWPPVLAAAWILAVDLFSGNVLEPWLYGARTGASPVAVIVSLVFWTWLWGAVGLLLATPITVCLVVLGKYVPQLEVFYILLSDRPALEAHLRFYQRLLARDRSEAMGIVRKAASNLTPEKILDTLVFPALAEIELDRRGGGLDVQSELFVQKTVDEIMQELLPPQDSTKAEAPATGPVRVLLVSEYGRFDETVARALARLCESHGRRAEALSSSLLTVEMIERVREERAATVVIASLHPARPRRIVHLCKRIESVSEPMRILVGPWVEAERQTHWRTLVAEVPRTQVCHQLADILSKLAYPSAAAEGVPALAPEGTIAAVQA